MTCRKRTQPCHLQVMSGEMRGEGSYAPIQIMQPEKRELATVPIPPVRSGIDSRAPMLQQDVEGYVKRRTDKTKN